MGIAAVLGARRKNPRRIRDLTHGPVVTEIVGFGLFWLGITHPTDHPAAPRQGSFPTYRCSSALSATYCARVARAPVLYRELTSRLW